MKKITLFFMSLLCWCGYSQGLPLETFEDAWLPNGPDVGWGIYQNAPIGAVQQWRQTALGNPFEAPCAGSYAAFINKENVPNTGDPARDWLVTPAFTLPANPQLRFTSRLVVNGNQGGVYKILIIDAAGDATTYPSTYVEVMSWIEPDLNPVQTDCIEKIVPLPTTGFTGPVRIAFYMQGDNGDSWIVDNVTVVEECFVPDGLAVDNITLNGGDLSWDPGTATQWGVEIVLADEAPTGVPDVIVDDPFYAANLDEDTEYKFYVRAICGPGNESGWSDPLTFHTVGLGDNCGAPIVIDALPFSTTNNTSNFGDEYEGIPGTSCGTDPWEEYLNGNDVVYAYTAPTTGVISIDMSGTVMSTGMFVYEDCDDIGVNCVAGGVFDWQEIPVSVPEFNVTAGQTYYILISTWAFPQVSPYTLVIQQVNCTPPVALPTTGIGLTSAELSWTNPSSSTSWEIVIQDPGDGIPAGSGTTVTDNSNLSVNAETDGTPFVSATPYEYYVRADCGDGTFSAWTGPIPFNTTICEVTDQCTYTFVMTDSWGDGWNGNTMTVAQNGIPLAVIGSTFTGGQGPVEVEVQMCNNLPFTLYWNTGGSFANEVGVSVQNSFGQTFYTKPFATGTQNSLLLTSEIDCDNPLCLPPSGLTVSNQQMESVDLSWDGPAAGDWEVFYVEAGGPAPTGATPGIDAPTNPFTLGGLDPSTNYDFYVRYVCSPTESSPWDGPVTSHTEVCDPADKCMYTFEMQSANGWGWEGNTMTVYQGGVPLAIIGEDFDWGTSMSVDIPLCPGVEMELYWNMGGWGQDDKGITVYSPFAEDIYNKPPGMGSQDSSLFTGIISCDPPPCPKPQNLSVSDIQLTSAILEWDEMGDATLWEVVILPYGSPAPTAPGTEVTTHPMSTTLLQELESGTTYSYYVRANCGAVDGYSTWSGPFTFTTAIENDDCAGATPVPVNPGVECIEVANGTVSGATSSGVMTSCNWQAPVYDVWFEFVAVEPTHSVSINNMMGGFYNMQIYGGADCDTLSEVYCGWDTATTVSGLIPGETYYIQVYTDWLNNPAAPTAFEVCVLTPASIITDNTTYTVPELVEDVLVTSTCAQISNVTWRTGNTDGFGSENGIAMFQSGMSDFPIEQGVVLSTGNAMSAPGPNTNTLSEGFWPGDDDLFNYIQDLGIDPNLWSYNNATVLEFDFVPLTSHMSFPFIFASEEYGTYQCDFSDAFAFFLTDQGGNTINLAVIPETTIPVSVITIRDAANNPFCDSQNVEYFDNYYEVGDMSAPINFNGNTISMTAEADVIVGQTYHIKLVIADRNDSSMDSAVFIGPFDIGDIDLGVDLTEDNGGALCEGDTYTIESGLNPDEYSFEWFLNGSGDPIPGETGPNLEVTEEGEYTIVAHYLASTCSGTDSLVIEFYDPVVEDAGDPIDLTACDDSGFYTFDLSTVTDIILANSNPPIDYDISYHLTEEDAENNVGALDLDYENATQFFQTIYVRIVNPDTGCVGVDQFSLIVGNTPPQFELTGDLTLCEGTSGTLTVTPIDFDPSGAIYTWTLEGNTFPGNGPSITVTDAGVYAVTVNTGCTGTMESTVTVVPEPVADTMADVTSCGSFILPGLSANNAYYTEPGGVGTALNVGQELTTNQTVYILATAGTCTDESSFAVTVVPAPVFEVAGDCLNNEYTLEVAFVGDMFNADNVIFEWADPSGATIGGNSPTAVAAVEGTYTLTVTPIGFEVNCPVVLPIELDNVSCLLPRGISPNNDGMNDSFDLSGFNVAKLSIFNRYGREVYSKTNYTNEWFGQTDGGDELPTGTYFFSMERDNGENRTGWVYINRQEN